MPAVTKVTKPRKSHAKKPKTNNITLEGLEAEYTSKHLAQTFPAELSFIKSYGNTHPVLKQFFNIQTSRLECGFTPSVLEHEPLAHAFNTNLDGLFSLDHYSKLEAMKLEPIALSDFYSTLQLNRKVEFQFNANEAITLNAMNISNFPNNPSNLRYGTVFNTGGLPLVAEWCPLLLNGKKFLFVCVVDENTDLSEFSNKCCCLTVIEYNQEAFKINKQILCNRIIKEINFSFASDSTSLMQLTLSNGTVEVWKIDSDFLLSESHELNYYRVLSGPKVLSIPNKTILITTSSFSSTNTLLIGTNHGHVGQFTIDSGKLDYLFSAKLPSITTIKNLLPVNGHNDSLCAFLSSADFACYLINLPSPNKKTCIMNNIKIMEVTQGNRELHFGRNTISLHSMNSFLTIESPSSIRKVTVDNPSNVSKIKISSDNEITCLACQKTNINGLQNDGFILVTGHTNGSVRLLNYLNVLSNLDKKQNPSTIRLMQMNKFNSNDDKFWLDLSYSADRIGDAPASQTKPKQLSVSKQRSLREVKHKSLCALSIAMKDNTIASCWGNGLIVIEDLII